MSKPFKRKKNKNDKHAPYYFNYTDHTGRRRMKKGYTDKGETQRLLDRMELEAGLRRSGQIDSHQEELAKLRQSAVEPHLVEFEQSLTRRKKSAKHVKLVMSRVRCIVQGCKFQQIGSITRTAVERFLADHRDETKCGHRTSNHYAQAFQQFCRWLYENGRVASNPVIRLPRLNNEVDVRHKRRALSSVEIVKLLESARTSSETIQCYDGETRYRLYLVAYMTGLRRGELASLTPESFKLEASPPLVTVQAADSKHRKTDRLPIHPALVSRLIIWLKEFGPGVALFPKLKGRKTWLMVKKDLERVGIEYRTAEGVADFHAAGRHTYITELLRNGASLPEARELARHSDVRMTMKYTHIGIEDQARAVAVLPNPCQQIVISSVVPSSQSEAGPVTETPKNADDAPDLNPSHVAPSDTQEQKKAPPVTEVPEWRRRELNPRPAIFPRQLLRV